MVSPGIPVESRALKDEELICLGNEFAVGVFNGEYSLVPTKEYHEEWD